MSGCGTTSTVAMRASSDGGCSSKCCTVRWSSRSRSATRWTMPWSNTGHSNRRLSSAASSLPPAPNSRLTVMSRISHGLVIVDSRDTYPPVNYIPPRPDRSLLLSSPWLRSCPRERSQPLEQQVRRRVDQLIGIDRDVRRAIGEALPRELENQPGHRYARGHFAVGVETKFAACLPPFDELGENPPPAHRPGLQPAVVDLRHVARHTLDEEGQDALARGIQLPEGAPEEAPDRRRDRSPPLLEHGLERLKCLVVVVLDRADEEIFLRREIMVDGPLGDADLRRDVLEFRVCVTALGEDVQRGFEELVRPVVGAALPAEHPGSSSASWHN